MRKQQIKKRLNMKYFPAVLFVLYLIGIPIGSAQAQMTDYPSVRLQALEKSTARTETLNAKVGDTIEYGSLFIKVQSCRKSDPLDKPEDAAFIQIWEVPVGKEKSEWAFSGWMFSSSPALSAMDHAVYDVWVLECTDPDNTVTPQPAPQEESEATVIIEGDEAEESDDALEEMLEETATQNDEISNMSEEVIIMQDDTASQGNEFYMDSEEMAAEGIAQEVQNIAPESGDSNSTMRAAVEGEEASFYIGQTQNFE